MASVLRSFACIALLSIEIYTAIQFANFASSVSRKIPSSDTDIPILQLYGKIVKNFGEVRAKQLIYQLSLRNYVFSAHNYSILQEPILTRNMNCWSSISQFADFVNQISGETSVSNNVSPLWMDLMRLLIYKIAERNAIEHIASLTIPKLRVFNPSLYVNRMIERASLEFSTRCEWKCFTESGNLTLWSQRVLKILQSELRSSIESIIKARLDKEILFPQTLSEYIKAEKLSEPPVGQTITLFCGKLPFIANVSDGRRLIVHRFVARTSEVESENGETDEKSIQTAIPVMLDGDTRTLIFEPVELFKKKSSKPLHSGDPKEKKSVLKSKELQVIFGPEWAINKSTLASGVKLEGNTLVFEAPDIKEDDGVSNAVVSEGPQVYLTSPSI